MTQAAELRVYLSREPAGADATGLPASHAATLGRRRGGTRRRAGDARVTADFPGLAGVVSSLPERRFGAVIEVRLAPTANASQVETVTRLRAAAAVDDAVYDREVLRRVLLTVTTARPVVTSLAVLLALAAFAVVARGAAARILRPA